MTEQTTKISVVIITKNEERNIERCLQSISWVDEIVVVDSGSSDRTIEICEKYNCIIVKSAWLGFGRTKKLAVDSATNNWIFSIDSDEEVTEELKRKIQEVLRNPKFNGYRIKRKSFYLERLIKHCGWNTDFPLRLFNRKYGNFNNKEVHESVQIGENVLTIKEHLFHYTYPTIEIHLEKMNRYSTIQAKEMYNSGKSYSVLLSVLFGINKFINMYIFRLGILDGKEGLILCSITSFGVYLKYIKLWKLNNK
ncbi:MAG: glycosyltransferase family 2 protein [Melioribacteraceae bacterium]|nr:glycosyltransferase family 2 protein [Melioribacteraceae bacterium]